MLKMLSHPFLLFSCRILHTRCMQLTAMFALFGIRFARRAEHVPDFGHFFFGAAARMFMYICMCVCVCVSALIYQAERACSSGVLVSPYPRLCVHVCVLVCACYPVLPPPAFWCVMTTMMMMTSLFLFRYFFFYPVTFYTSHFIWKFWR